MTIKLLEYYQDWYRERGRRAAHSEIPQRCGLLPFQHINYRLTLTKYRLTVSKDHSLEDWLRLIKQVKDLLGLTGILFSYWSFVDKVGVLPCCRRRLLKMTLG